MVYCAKCGTKNEDDARVCVKCGASLYAVGEERWRYRRMENECFGIPHGGTVVGLFIGFIIILAGISFLLQAAYNINMPWWPLVVILFGILMIVGALFGMRRRY